MNQDDSYDCSSTMAAAWILLFFFFIVTIFNLDGMKIVFTVHSKVVKMNLDVSAFVHSLQLRISVAYICVNCVQDGL